MSMSTPRRFSSRLLGATFTALAGSLVANPVIISNHSNETLQVIKLESRDDDRLGMNPVQTAWDKTSIPPGTELSLELDVPGTYRFMVARQKGTQQMWLKVSHGAFTTLSVMEEGRPLWGGMDQFAAELHFNSLVVNRGLDGHPMEQPAPASAAAAPAAAAAAPLPRRNLALSFAMVGPVGMPAAALVPPPPPQDHKSGQAAASSKK